MVQLSFDEGTGLSGSLVAIVTPFDSKGAVDRAAFEVLIERQIQHGTDGIVVCGTTGEAATLSDSEYRAVVRQCVENVAGRVPVIAGSGSNNTGHVVETSLVAEELGVDALLVVSPYYNKPTQEGLRRHYETVMDAVHIPVVLYNVPGRTASNISAATTLALSQHPNCLAVKEASGNLSQIQEIIFNAPEGFSVLSGDDALAFPMMALGASGVVGVASNVVPGEMKRLVEALAAENMAEARVLQAQLLPLMEAIFWESNPIPIKAALAHLGLIDEVLRLPLVPANPKTRARLVEIMDGP